MIADLYLRIEALVPNALCRTVNYEITEWIDPRPQPTEAALLAVDVVAIKAAIAAQKAADAAAVTSTKADNTVQYLVTHTPAECYDWVQANVTNLAQAKEVLGRMAMVISAIARQQLR